MSKVPSADSLRTKFHRVPDFVLHPCFMANASTPHWTSGPKSRKSSRAHSQASKTPVFVRKWRVLQCQCPSLVTTMHPDIRHAMDKWMILTGDHTCQSSPSSEAEGPLSPTGIGAGYSCLLNTHLHLLRRLPHNFDGWKGREGRHHGSFLVQRCFLMMKPSTKR